MDRVSLFLMMCRLTTVKKIIRELITVSGLAVGRDEADF